MQLTVQTGRSAMAEDGGTFFNMCLKNNINHIEIYLRKSPENILYLAQGAFLSSIKEMEKKITFKEICRIISNNEVLITLHCYLLEPNLELLIKKEIEEWDIVEQIMFTGAVDPSLISKWDRNKIIYNVENCLPKIYSIGEIKKTHFDVVNYFCKKYRIETVQIRADYFKEEMKAWCDEEQLSISVWKPKHFEEIQKFEELDVDNVSTEFAVEYLKEYKDQKYTVK